MPHLHHSHNEADERLELAWKPKNAAAFATMPAEWRDLIGEAVRVQQALEASDSQFVGSGSLISSSGWNQLKNGQYRVPTTARGIESISLTLRALVQRGNDLLADRETPVTPTALKLLERPELDLVLKALKVANQRLAAGIEERLITVVGATRSGKTCLIRLLADRQKIDWSFRALPSAKTHYRKFLEGLAKAVGMRDIGSKSACDLEDLLLARFSSAPCVLAIEELQRFSRRALEFLKSVLNDTQATILLFLKPAEWRLMRRTTNEDMQQFLGRNITTVMLKVDPAVVQRLAADAWAGGCPAPLAAEIAAEAEKGGGMSAVRVILQKCESYARGKPVTPVMVKAALKHYRSGVPELTAQAARLLAA